MSPPASVASTTSFTLPPWRARMSRTPRIGSLVNATARRGPSGAFHGSVTSSLVASCSAEYAASRSRRIESDAARGRVTARQTDATPRAPRRDLLAERAREAPARVGQLRLAAQCRARRAAAAWARVEQRLEHLRAGHAVDHAVMDLLEQRGPPVGEPFEQVHLPERALPVEGLCVQVRHGLAQLRLAAGRRQPPAHDMVSRQNSGSSSQLGWPSEKGTRMARWA